MAALTTENPQVLVCVKGLLCRAKVSAWKEKWEHFRPPTVAEAHSYIGSISSYRLPNKAFEGALESSG